MAHHIANIDNGRCMMHTTVHTTANLQARRWQGYGHWLGTGNVRVGYGQQFLTFNKALLYARTLKLKSHTEWKEWCNSGARPANIPSHPGKMYEHAGWQGYGHWLGAL